MKVHFVCFFKHDKYSASWKSLLVSLYIIFLPYHPSLSECDYCRNSIASTEIEIYHDTNFPILSSTNSMKIEVTRKVKVSRYKMN